MPQLDPSDVWFLYAHHAVRIVATRTRLMEAAMEKAMQNAGTTPASSQDGQVTRNADGTISKRITSMASLNTFFDQQCPPRK